MRDLIFAFRLFIGLFFPRAVKKYLEAE